jgi:hypothetical protein
MAKSNSHAHTTSSLAQIRTSVAARWFSLSSSSSDSGEALDLNPRTRLTRSGSEARNARSAVWACVGLKAADHVVMRSWSNPRIDSGDCICEWRPIEHRALRVKPLVPVHIGGRFAPWRGQRQTVPRTPEKSARREDRYRVPQGHAFANARAV